VGRGVRVGVGGLGVNVGRSVGEGLGVHDGIGVSVRAMVGLGVGVSSNATRVGSGLVPKGVSSGAKNATM
jgi:hypothetical protein